MPSFDLSSSVDIQILDNAVNVVKKEITNRFDFKGIHVLIDLNKKDYLVKLESDSDYWKKMPRRMLRHKAMQQCARIALAISVSEGPLENLSSKKSCETSNEASLDSKQSVQQTQTEKLKSLLAKNS